MYQSVLFSKKVKKMGSYFILIRVIHQGYMFSSLLLLLSSWKYSISVEVKLAHMFIFLSLTGFSRICLNIYYLLLGIFFLTFRNHKTIAESIAD